jgi:hypothetical protein
MCKPSLANLWLTVVPYMHDGQMDPYEKGEYDHADG